MAKAKKAVKPSADERYAAARQELVDELQTLIANESGRQEQLRTLLQDTADVDYL